MNPRVSLLVAVLCLSAFTGCESKLLHNLQPHRLYRMNRGPAPGRGALYSVSDNVPDDSVPASTGRFTNFQSTMVEESDDHNGYPIVSTADESALSAQGWSTTRVVGRTDQTHATTLQESDQFVPPVVSRDEGRARESSWTRHRSQQPNRLASDPLVHLAH